MRPIAVKSAAKPVTARRKYQPNCIIEAAGLSKSAAFFLICKKRESSTPRRTRKSEENLVRRGFSIFPVRREKH